MTKETGCIVNKSLVFQMLVVFKSAPILKRVLKVKHELLQLYVLKVSKVLGIILLHGKYENCYLNLFKNCIIVNKY